MDEESLIDAERMAIFEQKMRELTAEFIVTLDEWRTELEIFCTGGKAWTPDDLKQILMILPL